MLCSVGLQTLTGLQSKGIYQQQRYFNIENIIKNMVNGRDAMTTHSWDIYLFIKN